MRPASRSTLPWQQMAERLVSHAKAIEHVETVSLAGAMGRVLAKPLEAMLPLPAFTHAVMDGFALGSVPPGTFRVVDSPCITLRMGEALAVAAGSPVPDGTATVVLADHAIGNGPYLTIRDARSKDNIRREGEEAASGEILLSPGIRLDARHLALASATGERCLTVRRRPRIACLGLHASNHAFPHIGIFHALLDSATLRLTDAGTIRPMSLGQVLQRLAHNHDLIVIVAESLGAEQGDLLKTVQALGGEATALRAALKPAKPVIMGRLDQAQILGLAGTAYATTIAAHLFLSPLLRMFAGLPADDPFLPAWASFSRHREPGRAEALPVHVNGNHGRLNLTLAGRFGQLRALAAMDGFAMIPAEVGSIETGMPVTFGKLSFPLI